MAQCRKATRKELAQNCSLLARYLMDLKPILHVEGNASSFISPGRNSVSTSQSSFGNSSISSDLSEDCKPRFWDRCKVINIELVNTEDEYDKSPPRHKRGENKKRNKREFCPSGHRYESCYGHRARSESSDRNMSSEICDCESSSCSDFDERKHAPDKSPELVIFKNDQFQILVRKSQKKISSKSCHEMPSRKLWQTKSQRSCEKKNRRNSELCVRLNRPTPAGSKFKRPQGSHESSTSRKQIESKFSRSSLKRSSSIILPTSNNIHNISHPTKKHHSLEYVTRPPRYKIASTSTSVDETLNKSVQCCAQTHQQQLNQHQLNHHHYQHDFFSPGIKQTNLCEICSSTKRQPVPIKIGNYEKSFDPDEKFRVEMVMYTEETSEADCRSTSIPKAHCPYSSSCMRKTADVCNLDAYLRGEAEKDLANKGKDEEQDKKGKKGKDKKDKKENKDKDKDSKKKKQEDDKKSKKEKKKNGDKDEKPAEDKTQTETEQVLSQYRLKTVDKYGNEKEKIINNDQQKPTNIQESVVFKNIREIAPQGLGELMIIRNNKTKKSRKSQKLALQSIQESVDHESQSNLKSLSKITEQNTLIVNQTYPINYHHTKSLVNRTSSKKQSFVKSKLSSLIKCFENKLCKIIGKPSSSEGKGDGKIDQPVKTKSYHKLDNDFLQLIIEESFPPAQEKIYQLVTEKSRSRELFCINLAPLEAYTHCTQENSTQTSFNKVVLDNDNEKHDIQYAYNENKHPSEANDSHHESIILSVQPETNSNMNIRNEQCIEETMKNISNPVMSTVNEIKKENEHNNIVDVIDENQRISELTTERKQHVKQDHEMDKCSLQDMLKTIVETHMRLMNPNVKEYKYIAELRTLVENIKLNPCNSKFSNAKEKYIADLVALVESLRVNLLSNRSINHSGESLTAIIVKGIEDSHSTTIGKERTSKTQLEPMDVKVLESRTSRISKSKIPIKKSNYCNMVNTKEYITKPSSHSKRDRLRSVIKYKPNDILPDQATQSASYQTKLRKSCLKRALRKRKLNSTSKFSKRTSNSKSRV